MEPGAGMALLSVGTMLVMAALAFVDTTDGARGMLFPNQMMRRYPIGFPLIANGTIWSGIFILPFVLAIIGKYSWQWSAVQIWMALAVGMAVSYAMHRFVYLKGKFPDALAGGGRPISPAGWVNVVYFGAVLAAVLLFYFASEVTDGDLLLVTGLLATHNLLVHHVPLDMLNWRLCFVWCPDTFTEEMTPAYSAGAVFIMLAVVTAIKF